MILEFRNFEAYSLVSIFARYLYGIRMFAPFSDMKQYKG